MAERLASTLRNERVSPYEQLKLNVDKRREQYGTNDSPLWQKGLDAFAYPFEQIDKHVLKPALASTLALFVPELERKRDESWMQWKVREWEEWDDPGITMPFNSPMTGEKAKLGIKGTLEFAPWFAIPGIGWAGKGAMAGKGLAGTLAKVAPKLGKLEGGVRAGATALEFSPWGLAEKGLGVAGKAVVQRISPKLTKSGSFFAAPTNESIYGELTKSDFQRTVAGWLGRKPVLRGVVKAMGGEAAFVKGTERIRESISAGKVFKDLSSEELEDLTVIAMLTGARTESTLLAHKAAGMAHLGSIHPEPMKLFGVDDATGLANLVKPKGALKNYMPDVLENPTKFNLSDEQLNYIKTLHELEDQVLTALKGENIAIHEIKLDEFAHWVHRVVNGRKVDGKFVELTKGFGRIGSKQSFEKTRFYETAAEGINKAGLNYSSNPEHIMDLYIRSAAKRISDERVAKILRPYGVLPSERLAGAFQGEIKAALHTTKQLAGAKHLEKILLRAKRGEKLVGATLSANEKRFPGIGAKLRALVDKPASIKSKVAEFDELIKQARAMIVAGKKPYWQAKKELARAREISKTPKYGTEATIQHPAFQGRIFPAEVAKKMEDYFADRGFAPLTKAAEVSGVMRTLVAAADFSAMFIQGLPMIALHPKAWAKGATMSFRAFKDPTTYQKYLKNEAMVLNERAFYGGYVGGFEMLEAMPALQKLGKKIAGTRGESAVRQSYGRFEASFGSFGDVARNEMWKGLKGSVKNEGELFELARHLDRMTGVMSSKGLGIGRSQREFEQAFLFFAPRYTRAGFALIGDLFKGGYTGNQTRKALGYLAAGGAAFYTGVAEAMGQKPNWDATSSKFMTVEITDPITGKMRHFGVGGMMTSLIRFAADVGTTAIENPTDLIKPMKDGELNRYDNPFIKFMYSKSSPLTGFMTGMVTGKNYFGEPFESPTDYVKYMSEQVMPISLQQLVADEGGVTATGLFGEQLGMRTFPESKWEVRDDVRDQLAKEKHGISWDELAGPNGPGKKAQLDILNESPELRKATEEASEFASKMSRGEGKVWDAWHSDGKAIETRYQNAITSASAEFRKTFDGATFREKVDEAGSIRRAMYDSRSTDPAYNEVVAFFNESLTDADLSKMNRLDIARMNYYKSMYSPDMYDQFGNYRFDLADKREEQFINEWGQSAVDYIKEFSGAKWDEPGPYKALKEAREILKPYWAIESMVWDQYPQEARKLHEQILEMEMRNPESADRILRMYPQIVAIRKQVAQMKKWTKNMNPEIANALNVFYRR